MPEHIENPAKYYGFSWAPVPDIPVYDVLHTETLGIDHYVAQRGRTKYEERHSRLEALGVKMSSNRRTKLLYLGGGRTSVDDTDEVAITQGDGGTTHVEVHGDYKDFAVRKKDTLDETRQRLQDFSVYQKAMLRTYFLECEKSDVGDKIAKVVGNGTDLAFWLSNPYACSDEELGTVLDWHAENMLRYRQSGIVKGAIEKAASSFRTGLMQGVARGWFHERVSDTDVGEIGVRLVDPLDPNLNNGTVVGFTWSGADHVVMPSYVPNSYGFPPVLTASSNIKSNLIHEYGHTSLSANSDPEAPANMHWTMEEAMTEQSSIFIDRVVDGLPTNDEMHVWAGSYAPVRDTLDTLRRGPNGMIGVHEMTYAYTGTEEDRARLSDRYDQIWGVTDVLGKYTSKVDAITAEVLDSSKNPRDVSVLQAIYDRRDEFTDLPLRER